MKRTHSGIESTEVGSQIHVTSTLIFSLLVLSEHDAGEPSRDDTALLGAWRAQTLEHTLFKEQATSSWSALLRSGGEVCRAALREARRASDVDALQTLGQLALVFFRCTSAAMVEEACEGWSFEGLAWPQHSLIGEAAILVGNVVEGGHVSWYDAPPAKEL